MHEWWCVQGGSPTIQEALDLHFILSKSDTQLRQPVALEEQLMTDSRLDSVVGMSMLQLLQVSPLSLTTPGHMFWYFYQWLLCVKRVWVMGSAQSH